MILRFFREAYCNFKTYNSSISYDLYVYIMTITNIQAFLHFLSDAGSK